MTTNFEEQLKQLIRDHGPIPVAEYMEQCLAQYYQDQDPLGRDGDFITAPEICQIFGELIGIWAAEMWRLMGQPEDIKLIELGPGRGTLMSDALRACKAVPEFYKCLSIHLVEINNTLRTKQKENLSQYEMEVSHHSSLEGIGDGPAIIIANEFFDALPVRQLQRQNGAWYERCVTYADQLEYCLSQSPIDYDPTKEVREEVYEGAIFELRERCSYIIETLSKRRCMALLAIDYGHMESGYGDTLQAVQAHKYTDPLSNPGQADLTTQVDFNQLERFSQKFGLNSYGPMTQGQFLLMLGLEQRLTQLLSSASEEQSIDLKTGVMRLVAPEQMGVLFKVMSILSPGLPKPPPFV